MPAIRLQVARMCLPVRFSPTMRPLLFLLALSTASADWPTYLHDASRVGATKEESNCRSSRRGRLNHPQRRKWPGQAKTDA
jgi:hypothetical protein